MNPDNYNAAIDSFIVKTCKDTTVQRRRKCKEYKGPDSSWGTVQWAMSMEGRCMLP